MKRVALLSVVCLLVVGALGQTPTYVSCGPQNPCPAGQTCNYVLTGANAFGRCYINPTCNGIGSQPDTCSDGSPCINGVCGSSASPDSGGGNSAIKHLNAEVAFQLKPIRLKF